MGPLRTIGSVDEYGPVVGRVIGTEDATPLEFWVGVGRRRLLQLDDVVSLERVVPGTGELVRMYGVVSQVRARHEGARFDSDVFLIEDGVLPAEVSEAAKVQTTRFEPELFVPPRPGEPVRRASATPREEALLFAEHDPAPALRRLPRRRAVLRQLRLRRRVPRRPHQHQRDLGSRHQDQLRHLSPVRHLPQWTVGSRGPQHQGPGLQRQGRGPSLPRPQEHPARPRCRSTATRQLGLPVGAFESLAVWAPPRRGEASARPDVAGRTFGVQVVLLDDRGLLPPGAAAVPVRRRRGRPPAVHPRGPQRGPPAAPVRQPGGRRCGQHRRRHPAPLRRPRRVPHRARHRRRRRHLAGSGHQHRHGPCLRPPAAQLGPPRGPSHPGRRRPSRTPPGRARAAGHGHRSPQPERPGQAVRGRGRSSGEPSRPRSSPARPTRCSSCCSTSSTSTRHVEGSSPIKEILLDVAERGRSLGVILIGCQQTASEVERRIIANSAIRVVGPARSGRGRAGRVRVPLAHPPAAGDDRQAGHDDRLPARAAGPAGRRVPVPGVGHARIGGRRQPGGGWRPTPRPIRSTASREGFRLASRACSASMRRRPSAGMSACCRSTGAAGSTGWRGAPAGASAPRTPRQTTRLAPVRRSPRQAPLARRKMKILHTADWHVGRLLRGRSRAAEHEAALASIAVTARSEDVDLVIVAGDVFDTRRPVARRRAHRVPGPARPGRHRRHRAGRRRQPRQRTPAAGGGPAAGAGPGHHPGQLRPPRRGRSGRGAVPRRQGDGPGGGPALPVPAPRRAGRPTSWSPTPATTAWPTPTGSGRLVAALTAAVPPRHRQPGGRPLHGRRGARSAAASARPTPSSSTRCPPPSSRARPTTSPSATFTAGRSLPGACPIHYSGSPLQLDFGEGENEPSVILVDAVPGRPAPSPTWRSTGGRRLRTVRGSLAELRGAVGVHGRGRRPRASRCP